MPMRYEDFVIQIGPRRGEDGHSVRILSSPAGEGAGVFLPPFEGDVVKPMLRHGTRSGHRLRSEAAAVTLDTDRHLGVSFADDRGVGCSESAAQELGDRLFRALFSGQVQTLYDQSLGAIRSRPGCGLRLKLKLDPGEQELGRLSGLPWELLWRRETEDFLSLSRLSPLVRYLDVPRPASPIKVRSKLRILVAVASPEDLPPLAMESEKGLLAEAWRRWKNVEVKFLDKANSQTLRQALLEEPFHALHFMGHGGFDPVTGEGVLYFEREDGSSETVSGRALATLLKDFKNLGMVFLNACETACASPEGARPFSGVANALVLGGLPSVIAMQFPISDQAAIAFSSAFYQRLAAGDPVDAAVVEGRQAVLASAPGTLEWGTPVLFLRVPDANIFQVAGRQREAGIEEPEPRNRRIGWLGAAGALLLATVLGLGMTPVLRHWISPPTEEKPEPSSGYRVELSQAFASTLQGLSGVLTRIEILPNGRMRLFFRFRNQSPRNVNLGFDYQSTYLADRNGNRYRMLAADGEAKPGEVAVDQVQPGGEIERWFEFPAPLDQAQSFNVGLVGHDGGPGFPLFAIDLPAYPKELSKPSPPPPPLPPDSTVLSVSRSFETSIQGLRSQLDRVEMLANGRMRWRFAFLNGSERDQTLGFDYSRIYLEDKEGHRYPVVAFDTGARSVYRELVQRAVRVDRWIEFAAPLNGARDFTVVLVSHDRRTLRFDPFKVRIPYYPEKYSRAVAATSQAQPPLPTEMAAASTADTPSESPLEVQPPPTEPERLPKVQLEPPVASIPYKADTVWNTSIEGLQGSLQAFERLDGNRVRWIMELRNQTGTAQEIGFNLDDSYLSDNLGHRYTIVRSDAERLHREVIPPGGRVTHWFEFPNPARGASRFIVVLSSHSPASLRYRPFQIDLPQEAK